MSVCTSCIQIAPTQRLSCDDTISLYWGLNPGPSVYKTDALPLSYRGFCARGYAPNKQYYVGAGPLQGANSIGQQLVREHQYLGGIGAPATFVREFTCGVLLRHRDNGSRGPTSCR